MYPDLLEIFGITLYGVTFERILWLVSSGLMIWGVINSFQILKKGRKQEGGIQLVIVSVLLIWFGMKFFQTFSADYKLMFSQAIVIHSYAFCILIGIICGVLSAMWMAPSRGMERMWIAKLCLWCVLVGMTGARLGYVIVERQFFIDSCLNPQLVGLTEPNCLRALNVSEGGLVFYGGVIAGFICLFGGYFYQKRRNPKFKILALADSLAPALAVSHGFGRIGCIAAGCCWGAITRGGGGIEYPKGSFAYEALLRDPKWQDWVLQAGHTPGMHATQLYEAGVEFLLLGIILFLAYRQNLKTKAIMAEEAAFNLEESSQSSAKEAVESSKPGETVKEAVESSKPGETVKEAVESSKPGETVKEAVESSKSAETVKEAVEKVDGESGVAGAVDGGKKSWVDAEVCREMPLKYGRLAALWLIAYGFSRIVIECMRDDGERGYYFEKVIEPVNSVLNVPLEHATILTTSQGIGIGMIVVGCVFLILSNKKRT